MIERIARRTAVACVVIAMLFAIVTRTLASVAVPLWVTGRSVATEFWAASLTG